VMSAVAYPSCLRNRHARAVTLWFGEKKDKFGAFPLLSCPKGIIDMKSIFHARSAIVMLFTIALGTAVVTHPESCRAEFFKSVQSYPAKVVGSPPTLNWPQPGPRPIVVIRYVADVTPDAAAAVKTRYLAGPYYAMGQPDNSAFGKPQENALDRMLVNTVFYVTEYRTRLAAQYPQIQFIFDPRRLAKTPDGKIDWEVSSIHPSADAVVDFTAYIWPQEMAAASGVVAPLISIRVAPSSSPATQGLVSTSTYMAGLGSAAVVGSDDPYDASGPSLVDLMQTTAKDPGDLRPAFGAMNSSKERPWNGTKAVLLRPLFAAPEQDKTNIGNYTLPGSIDVFGYLLIDSLNHVAAARNPAVAPADYIASFDPSLAGNLTTDPTTALRISVLSSFRQAEGEFLGHQAKAVCDAVQTGAFSDSFHVTRNKELAAAKKAKVVGWLTVVASAATFGIAGSVATLSTAMMSAEEAMKQSLNQNMVTILSRQVDVAVTISDQERTLSATSLAELRGKLHSLYSSQFHAN
jgi:hypothetical protein